MFRPIFVITQQSFQCFFNVVFWLIRRRDVGQSLITVETTLRNSTLEFATSNNFKSSWCITTWKWTTLHNVETKLLFSTSSLTTLINVETMLWKWPFPKKQKKIISNRIHGNQRFNFHFIIFFTLLSMLRGIRRRVLEKPWKFFKNHEKYYIARTSFKPLHFVKYSLVFNFTRGLVQLYYD